MNDDLRIPKITPPFYPGHNNYQNYRILAFLPYIIMGYEKIKFNVFMLVRYKYPGSGLDRIVPFKDISNSIRTPFFLSLPLYLVFDLIQRNRKYNKNKTIKEKAIFTTDLLLFHSFATIVFPFYISRFLSEFFPKSFGFFVRSKFPLMFLSVISFLAIGAVSVKLSDILSDYLLDNTFRKYVYNLNSLDPTKLNNKFQEINKRSEIAVIV
jgi:hypothetical protein